MRVLRGVLVGAVIGAATLAGAGAAAAAPLSLEPHAPAVTEQIADNCQTVIHPLAQFSCILSSLSG
ncbi:Uncharacterised protein [Nocardia otitidiscaviarum]|uniref:Uncharacterized protein n=1 Tax=Nocardia otitidiscaviarum TaxID=1823 RepID=A0A378YB10_9NOCA|nr:hypothetical protein [Nocardia otitidiscaviarum]SUA74426.1 Uncharacterised protein [Nocardia otitidiscaviarum]